MVRFGPECDRYLRMAGHEGVGRIAWNAAPDRFLGAGDQQHDDVLHRNPAEVVAARFGCGLFGEERRMAGLRDHLRDSVPFE
jgi:hypothetical protein